MVYFSYTRNNLKKGIRCDVYLVLSICLMSRLHKSRLGKNNNKIHSTARQLKNWKAALGRVVGAQVIGV